MNKLMSILAAGALALAASGVSLAADENQGQQPPGTPKAQEPTPAEQSKQEQDYLAALKKCDGLEDSAKQKCVNEAKQKHNRM